VGNFEWRNASLFAAPLRTRSGGVIGAIRRDAGRCNGIGNLFQRRAIHSSRDAAVVRLASSGIAEVNDPIEKTLNLANPGNFSRDLARAETYQE
jgi:hypothetical protein